MAFLDMEGLAYFWQQILARLNNFVLAEEGKGLSENNYTTAEKTKLSGIAEGATKTTVDSVLSNTSENPVQNKVINSAITSHTSNTTIHITSDERIAWNGNITTLSALETTLSTI